MPAGIRILLPGDEDLLARIAPEVFDKNINQRLSTEFLNDPRHHLVVAIDGGLIVGFVSAVHYVHPDKSSELWINEVSVAPGHRQQGLAKKLLGAMFDVGRTLKCRDAWVLTDRPNVAAMRLYESVGGTDSDRVMFTFKL